MPVAVAIDRSNNTDSWLVFFLLLAATAALRGRGLSLVAAMALLGVAFNVKMLAALVCGPALLAGWWFAGTLDWRRRLGWMAAAGVDPRRRVAGLGGGLRPHAARTAGPMPAAATTIPCSS